MISDRTSYWDDKAQRYLKRLFQMGVMIQHETHNLTGGDVMLSDKSTYAFFVCGNKTFDLKRKEPSSNVTRLTSSQILDLFNYNGHFIKLNDSKSTLRPILNVSGTTKYNANKLATQTAKKAKEAAASVRNKSIQTLVTPGLTYLNKLIEENGENDKGRLKEHVDALQEFINTGLAKTKPSDPEYGEHAVTEIGNFSTDKDFSKDKIEKMKKYYTTNKLHEQLKCKEDDISVYVFKIGSSTSLGGDRDNLILYPPAPQ